MTAAAGRPFPPPPAPPSALPLVLAYHRISRVPLPAGTWVAPHRLAAQIEILIRSGRRFVAPDELGPDVAAPGAGGSILFSFDDGTADLHEHRRILSRRGIRPVVFVPADRIGRRNDWEWPVPGRRTRHLDGRELRELVDLGWEVGLHGATHADLVACPDERLAEELDGGRRRLEAACGAPVRWLSYPYGRVDGRVARAATDAGLEAGFVLGARSRCAAIEPRWRRPRRPVYCIDTAADVAAKADDPRGATLRGRWQLWKEQGAHAVGRWTVARFGDRLAASAPRRQPDGQSDQSVREQ